MNDRINFSGWSSLVSTISLGFPFRTDSKILDQNEDEVFRDLIKWSTKVGEVGDDLETNFYVIQLLPINVEITQITNEEPSLD